MKMCDVLRKLFWVFGMHSYAWLNDCWRASGRESESERMRRSVREMAKKHSLLYNNTAIKDNRISVTVFLCARLIANSPNINNMQLIFNLIIARASYVIVQNIYIFISKWKASNFNGNKGEPIQFKGHSCHTYSHIHRKVNNFDMIIERIASEIRTFSNRWHMPQKLHSRDIKSHLVPESHMFQQ